MAQWVNDPACLCGVADCFSCMGTRLRKGRKRIVAPLSLVSTFELLRKHNLRKAGTALWWDVISCLDSDP